MHSSCATYCMSIMNSNTFLLHNALAYRPKARSKASPSTTAHDAENVDQETGPKRPTTAEQTQSFLKDYDFFLLLDNSNAMGKQTGSGDSYWEETKRHVTPIFNEILSIKGKGPSVCVYHEDETAWRKEVKKTEKLSLILSRHEPQGSECLHKALPEALSKHFKRRKSNSEQKSIILVVTNSPPEHVAEIGRSLEKYCAKLNRDHFFDRVDPKTGETTKKTTEIGILLLQIGKNKDLKRYCSDLDGDYIEMGKDDLDVIETHKLGAIRSAEDVRKVLLDAIFESD